jgi:hypothetical protein
VSTKHRYTLAGMTSASDTAASSAWLRPHSVAEAVSGFSCSHTPHLQQRNDLANQGSVKEAPSDGA